MIGAKLFILLYLVYMAQAQYRRTISGPLPVKVLPTRSPSNSNVIEIGAISPSLKKLLGTISKPSDPNPEQSTIEEDQTYNFTAGASMTRPISNSPQDLSISHFLELELDPEPEPQQESELELEPEPKSEPELDLESESELEPELEPELETEPESELEPEPKLEPELDLESESELRPEPEPELETELESELEPEPDAKWKQEQDSEFETELEPALTSPQVELATLKPNSNVPIFQSRSHSESDPEAESENNAEYEPEPEPEPKPELDSEPELKPVPESHNISTSTLRPAVSVHCKTKNAYYAIPHICDTYVECQNHIAKKKICPDGLLFNPKANWPRHPCSYPSEVECDNNTITEVQTTSGQCPRRFGSFALNDGDCGKYIVCDDGRPSLMSCPAGLAFNSKIGGCDWPANVPNCNPKVFKGFKCPVPTTDSSGKISDKVYNYRYKKSCKEYVACIKGEPRLLRCDSGLSFDETTSRCIDSDAVLNCKIVSGLVDTKLSIKRV